MIEIIPNWHPVFVHFTVGLLSIAVLLSVITQFMPAGKLREQWQLVAQWNLWIGAGITVITVVAGVVAYNSVAHDTPSHEAMTEHRNWALGTAAMFIVLAVWSWRRAKAGLGMSFVLLMALLVSGGLLASTAWLGGESVYRFGLGVMSLPKTDTHDHASGEHDDGNDGDHHAQASTQEKVDSHEHADSDEHTGSHEHVDDRSIKSKPISTLYVNDSDNCELPEKHTQTEDSSHSETHEHASADAHHEVKKTEAQAAGSVKDHHEHGSHPH